MGAELMAVPDAGIIALVVASIGAFSTGLANFALQILQYKREDRAHRWAIEQSQQDVRDRQRLAAIAHASALHGVATLREKIDENTEISVAAFKEANDVNRKTSASTAIAAQALAVANRVDKKLTDIGAVRVNQIDRLNAVSEDTNVTAHRIDDKLEPL